MQGRTKPGRDQTCFGLIVASVWPFRGHSHSTCVGSEIRGAEAFDLLQLLNTGHSGTLSTVHANSALQAISRFTSCVLQSDVELPYRAIKSNIADSLNLLVHVERRPGTRFVSEVSEIVRYNSDTDGYDLKQLFVRAEGQ